MTTPEHLRTAIGTWTGTSRLFLPGEPTRESPSTALVGLVARDKFATTAYTWTFEGEPQEGLLVVGGDEEAAQAIFLDSWHMGDKIMVMRGQPGDGHATVVRGSYTVEGSLDWGWRVDIETDVDGLRVVMYNVTPEGEEALGFECTFVRVTATT